jgi:hypothetical protein
MVLAMTEWKDRIETQLRRLSGSATFAKAARLRRFLEFVVEHAVKHPDEGLKEITIGIELYAIGQDFDPRISSVVRVDAERCGPDEIVPNRKRAIGKCFQSGPHLRPHL